MRFADPNRRIKAVAQLILFVVPRQPSTAPLIRGEQR